MKGRTVNNGGLSTVGPYGFKKVGNHCQHAIMISLVLRICLMNSMGVRVLLARCCRWRWQQTIEIRNWSRVRLVLEARQRLLQWGGWLR